MKLKIEIEMDNAAFEGANRNLEAAAILRDLADDMEEGRELTTMDDTAFLSDGNGNTVGKAQVIK